jgi:SAM-dependent methyltransferase
MNMKNSNERDAELSIQQIGSIEGQRIRYNKEAYIHETHHGDKYSQRYRTEFIRDRLFNFDVANLKILDAMCASGVETQYLISKKANIVGLDISDKNAEIYFKKWKIFCHISSIHKTEFDSETFDVVYIYGGLHHVIPLLESVIDEVHRILKPGGLFIFVEPNRDTWLNKFRSIWYKLDSRFEDSEAALSYGDQIAPKLVKNFKEVDYIEGGGIAYLVISQSLIIGTPKLMKGFLYPVLTYIERLTNDLPLAPKLFFAAKWQKKD